MVNSIESMMMMIVHYHLVFFPYSPVPTAYGQLYVATCSSCTPRVIINF